MKQTAFLFILVVGILAVFTASCSQAPPAKRLNAPRSEMAKRTEFTPAPAPTKKTVPVPPFQTGDSLLNLAPTMSPEIYTGQVRSAYMIAKEIPQTLAQMPCYCGCDKSSARHKSLHACYIDDHASKCGVCMNEAFTAYQLEKQQKMKPDEIREKIIIQYSPQY